LFASKGFKAVSKRKSELSCVLSPVVDNEILGLSAEEKEKIRRETLANLE